MPPSANADRTVLVTGGSGMLGEQLVADLRATGVHVRVVTRGDPDTLPADIEVVRGDLRERATIDAAVRGVSSVYHLAAMTRKWAPDARAFDAVNVRAAVELARAAADAGAQRIVHASSFTVFGPTPADGSPGAHAELAPSGSLQNDYQRSKRMAHEQLTRLAREDGLPVVLAAPGVLFGPAAPRHANPIAECMAMQLQRKFRVFPGGGRKIWPLAFLPDVSAGLRLIRDAGTLGSCYLLGGETRPLRDVFTWVETHSDIRGPTFSPPLWPFSILGKCIQGASRLTGSTPRLTHAALRFLATHWCYTPDSSLRRLGYRVTPLATALGRTWQHLHEQSIVAQPPPAAVLEAGG